MNNLLSDGLRCIKDAILDGIFGGIQDFFMDKLYEKIFGEDKE